MFELHVLPTTSGRDEVGTFIIYRPRAGLAFVGNRAMADLAVSLSQGHEDHRNAADQALAFLDRVGFLASDPPMPAVPARDFRPAMAVLLMTNQCQLRCTYCYAAAGASPAETLDSAVGVVAIDHVHAMAREQGYDHFDVSLHGGGEPTRAWRSMQACVEHARSKPLRAEVTLTSNAVWSRRQCDWITENLDGVTVSVDGSPETQDGQRPFSNGRGSSSVVLRNVAELDRRCFPYAIRVTATAPWGHLADDVRFLCETTECQSIHVEPAFNTSRGGHPRPSEKESEVFAQAYLEAFRTAMGSGRELVYSGAQVGAVAAIHCSAPYDALIVTTRGELVTCYEVTSPSHPLAGISRIGRIVDGRVVVGENGHEPLHSLLDERRQLCRDCWCFRTCAGDCYARAFDSGEGGHLSHSSRCDMNRDITKGILLTLVANGGGVWRRDDPPVGVGPWAET